MVSSHILQFCEPLIDLDDEVTHVVKGTESEKYQHIYKAEFQLLSSLPRKCGELHNILCYGTSITVFHLATHLFLS